MASEHKPGTPNLLMWMLYLLTIAFLVLGVAFFYCSIQQQKEGPRIVRGHDVTCVLMGQALQCWPEVSVTDLPDLPEPQRQGLQL
ncbi:hypothetical protein [Pseudomonas sp. zfem005]|uniref:hypothetical protein n=1 Tax=Pseudomonas sp. zfem005 TaxID=3078200 RepID=UPI00292768E9|nr:hypothetical protein [Pseudomonas sp. zfem005]MDU9416195.1 hypothetical protein [Pseudomonas sp. zfem005]